MARYVRGGGGQQWPIHALVTPALLTFSSLSLFLCARLTPPASYVGRPVREPFDLAVCDNSFFSTPCNAGSLGLRDGDIGNVFAWPARALHGQMGPARFSFASNSPPTYYSSAPRVALGHWGGGRAGDCKSAFVRPDGRSRARHSARLAQPRVGSVLLRGGAFGRFRKAFIYVHCLKS